ncbi:3-phosphoserine/phosphohydroxythreonine transaminase [Pseudomonas sp. SMV7]|uniref:3-phosphoserine/phosphohydroxythreonine transaminase n=1 Tax=Pseudomonas sp. SMV7 TaxID=3390194 RepID=UPI003F853C3D
MNSSVVIGNSACSDYRTYNFSAGPSALPHSVIKRVQAELDNWQGRGLSIMEMSHCSEEFMEIAKKAEADLRSLLGIPEHYSVLFLPGGASLQFSQIPLNLLGKYDKADYLDTGIRSQQAIKEAHRYTAVNVAGSSRASGYCSIPRPDEWTISKYTAYLHYTANETVGGLELSVAPKIDWIPLVADFSSSILSRPIEVSRFGLIYAGAQENIGPSGLTLVIIRQDLLDLASKSCPAVLNYKVMAEHRSMYDTPPTFSWYISGLVFEWLQEQGGLAAIAAVNERKQRLLYDYIDRSELYFNPIASEYRSWTNVPFRLGDARLDELFLAGAKECGLLGLQGHPSVGGMRASLYNTVSEEAVQSLVEYMSVFERSFG